MKALTPAAIAAAAGLSASLAQPSWHSASNHVGSPDIALTASSACPMGFRLRLTTASSPPLPAESSSSSCGLPIRLRLLSTLPRDNAVTFGYRALAYPGKDFHLAGCAPLRTHCSPCEARTAIVGAAFFAPLFWRSKKAGRSPGRTPGYSPRQ